MGKTKLKPGTVLKAEGLYDPKFEHDSCGIGFVADSKNRKSREIVESGLKMLINLEHRGALGADPETGDGAGILTQMPDEFMREIASELDFTLPEVGLYGVAMLFLPRDKSVRAKAEIIMEKIIIDEGHDLLAWRDVPVDESVPGLGAKINMPFMRQCFVASGSETEDIDEFERKLYLLRRVIDHRVRAELKLTRQQYYVPSFSNKTILYKGMLLSGQVPKFYKDLNHKKFKSALAMVHMRFSTNTLPSWELAQPFRSIAHNGEINTVRGNMNWMNTREKIMKSEVFGEDLKRMLPIVMEEMSDSAVFDSVLELLVMGGRSLPHAMMMMIPEAWSKNDLMDEQRKAFYEFHASIMEPWDGPAAVMFTDGSVIGATLDRNGLRPARYYVTKDDMIILSSEAGVLPVDQSRISYKGKLEPGRLFLVDLNKGCVIDDKELKKKITGRQPYKRWIEDNIVRLKDLPEPESYEPNHLEDIVQRQKIFGYNKEDLHTVLAPMFQTGVEALGSMGVDAPLAVLSEKPQLLFRYFKQLFAQVTNPPVDAIREELVMELITYIGPEQNLLDESPNHVHRLEIEHPVLTNKELAQVKGISVGHFKSTTLSILFNPEKKHDLRNTLDSVCEEAVEKIREGYNILVLSDRGVGPDKSPIPVLLAVAGVHHHLIRQGKRTKTAIVVETGEAREVHHIALLCGYGANAVNPYLVYETIQHMFQNNFLPAIDSFEVAEKNYKKAIRKGMFKVFSKMGICTLQSYCGAQIFEAVGIDGEIVDSYFTGTTTKIEGLSLEMLEQETLKRHKAAYDPLASKRVLPSGGLYNYRVDGEKHLFNPLTIAKLQTSTRVGNQKEFREFTRMVDEQSKARVTLRSLFDLDTIENPLKIEEIEPATEIVKRFSTGAMSFGSISWEAHTSLAIAMNRIGGKSNTGEGGEDPIRFITMKNGDSMRSAIKQVASGRFGVTANYLVNADELQIKMAQGAKPGEGGQLPGFKVDKIIANTRYSTPGVTLISPPPHHDIYSIEDLKQLIFDLKNINPRARISVKLVAESGVGTIAAGVAKAHADHILISGHDGGTGASPIASIHYAGGPWEIGLSETQQTLVMNGLRDRVHLATDGKLLTGRDVIIGALLGADEFGFSTGPLVTVGCIMMRKCHLNTCPVGIATQDPELRAKFHGSPDSVVNFMMFLAEEVREYMAALGYRTFNEMIGQVDRIIPSRPKKHWKARGVDFSRLLVKPEPLFETKLYKHTEQNHGLELQLDNELIRLAKPALDKREPVKIDLPIENTNRTVGAMLSGEVAKRYSTDELAEGTIDITMRGSAGQSFGCWLAKGISLKIFGESQDYTGKGLSGGRLIVQVPDEITFDPAKNFIIGNTCFYGATSGEAYINGLAGERFCVRNSGVHAVVEGIGEHGCEYMTGGRAVIIGKIGRNFAAGMSGGIAYIWDPDKKIDNFLNPEMVEKEKLEDPKEIEYVFNRLTKHKEYTNSKRASFILSDWEDEIANFVKIIPGEYKIALLKLQEEKETTVEEKHEVTIHG